ncbi:MAG: hypothetical protein ACI8T1_001055 [Verrucomicrobiales bacterium]|jgi:hypothetical protein
MIEATEKIDRVQSFAEGLVKIRRFPRALD